MGGMCVCGCADVCVCGVCGCMSVLSCAGVVVWLW